MEATPVIAAVMDGCEAMLGTGARKVLAGVLPEIHAIPVKVAQSMAFDSMEEEDFGAFFEGSRRGPASTMPRRCSTMSGGSFG